MISPRLSGKWWLAMAVLGGLGVAAMIFWFVRERGSAQAAEGKPNRSNSGEASVSVGVVSPISGGIDRVCQQPATVEPFESADLYAKAAGFLVEQKVDIGDRVKAGDVLARISVPEYEKQVQQEIAEVARVHAHVDQMAAAIETAEADLGAATAAVALMVAEKKSKISFREYREKQRDRIKDLASRMAIEAKLVDEQQDQYQAAVGAELAASEGVSAAIKKEAAAKARVKQARADLEAAKAEIAIAKARMEKAQVMLDYTVIRSPYTGVITRRNFHVGDFVRSAESGGERLPLFSVERTDIMRVIIQVPESDVPYVDRGDPVVIKVDALPGVIFKSEGANKVVVSRFAESEDSQTRMMRTEVDIKNADGKLRRGMFGRAILTLQVGLPGSLQIPSSALVGKSDGKNGKVRVVRDGKLYQVPVEYGADNGSWVEVLSGITAHDQVVVRITGTVDDGTPVTVTEAKGGSSPH